MSGLARLDAAHRDLTLVLRVRGEVDVSNARELAAEIEAAVPNDAPSVAVDLTDTTYLDSAGVQLLFRLAQRLRSRRQALAVIVPAASAIRAVLELTALSSVASVVDSFDAIGQRADTA
jgi:anti-anti-sigma factor